MGKYLVFASVGFELAGLVIGSYYLGQFLDNWLHTKGLIFAILAFLGLVGWLVRVIWLVKKFQKDEEAEKGPDNPL